MAEPSLATTRGVDLATASKIIDTALGLARSRTLRPMTIAVLDSGGDLVAFKDGRIVGSVGSSGDEAEADEAIAIAAIRAAGFIPEPAEPQGLAS